MTPSAQLGRPAYRGANARAAILTCVATLFILSGLCFPLPGQAQSAPATLRHDRLDVIFSSSLLPTVNRDDALALVRVWAETLGRQKDVVVEINASVADSVAEIGSRLQQGPVAWVLLDPVEYFELESLGLLEPAFMGTFGKDDEPERFLLVTSPESGATAVSDLRGKSLVIQSEYRSNLGQMWIEVLLHERNLGPADRFFGALSGASKPSAAALPVFFGKIGAGVVDKNSFEVMKEMNPQIGVRLRVLAESPPLVRGFLCVDTRHQFYHAELLKGLQDLDRSPSGKQILMLFKANRLTPMSRDDLTQVRALYTKYRFISKGAAAKIAEGSALHPTGSSQREERR